ncbi:Flp pilus assembly protein CpaB [bacterium]|nr:Flp pilus assembly protein CpaB [bacterium]
MFGVVGLLVAAYVAKNLLARDETVPAPTTRNVPMAIADIPAGTMITENHLGQGPYPIDRMSRDMLLVNRVIVGRVAKTDIKSAQPIQANQLYQPGELPSLSEMIAPGMRAVSVEVANTGAMVDGMIKPKEFVDVLFTYNASTDDDRFQGGLTMRLFEGVKVIAVNRSYQQVRVERSGNHVTLELSEPQANILVLAKDRGAITLAYNPSGAGNGGLALTNTERVTLYEILGLKPADPAPEPFMSEIWRGQGLDTLFFDEKGRRVSGRANTGARWGFDYKRFFGVPSGIDNPGGNRGNNLVLPPTNPNSAPSDSGASSAPTVQQQVPQPLESPSRRAPTALRDLPMNN